MDRSDFGEDFIWGVSTAAYQIEGAHNLYGKGESIWDQFVNKKGKILNEDKGNISCDFYNRFEGDLALMRAMNIPNFRFSISWSRIFPDGIGRPNQMGVDFYNRLIDQCLELNIQPWITLYHWDLPSALENLGGWTNRDIVFWFGQYVSFCISTFGDRVKNWMVLNEPMVFTGAGYFLGVHAPGKKGLSNFLAATHHAALCQAEGGRIIKSLRNDLSVGTTFSCSYIQPSSNKERDILAAKRVDTLLNRTFIEPLLGLGYPSQDLKALRRIENYMKADDENKLKFDMDFIGIQNYTQEIVSHSYFTPFLKAKIIKADERKVEKTAMNWEVYPESIYQMLKKFSLYDGVKKLIVTENGAAFNDEVINGEVHDIQRKEYLQKYIAEVLRAKQEGINVQGYFVWSFTDNFEWAEGFLPRFGLVHINYKNQKRIIKDSGKWYKSFLKTY
ncbi:GH1 family beta-glucosidase [Albibacterium bauzanense]|uniref:Beta-glucosidase n=1 Tax=Albibacterium bauzanense TaxID=653929 RepID=A0A4R1M176_9SPHI|nr:GH1 family beta-glucosidase [Albibacterium bauzanense]TCK85688.1 beta-glucosidase [Albibacterium bauzanense]